MGRPGEAGEEGVPVGGVVPGDRGAFVDVGIVRGVREDVGAGEVVALPVGDVGPVLLVGSFGVAVSSGDGVSSVVGVEVALRSIGVRSRGAGDELPGCGMTGGVVAVRGAAAASARPAYVGGRLRCPARDPASSLCAGGTVCDGRDAATCWPERGSEAPVSGEPPSVGSSTSNAYAAHPIIAAAAASRPRRIR